jgi:hypothetical protein
MEDDRPCEARTQPRSASSGLQSCSLAERIEHARAAYERWTLAQQSTGSEPASGNSE